MDDQGAARESQAAAAGRTAETRTPRARLFVAVPLPARLLAHVQGAQALLPSRSEVRTLRPEQLHVTLAFVGEVGPDKAASAWQVIEELPQDLGGHARMSGFLMLPSTARPRVVTLAIEDTSQVFGTLFEAVMAGLETAGVMRREKRLFRPHLTIARVKAGVVQPKADAGAVTYAIESVRLYRSELKRTGAEYTVVAERRLRPRKSDTRDVGEGR
jgi:2'-5' RNA ligase